MEAPGHVFECPLADPVIGNRRRPSSEAPESVRKSRRLREQQLRRHISSTSKETEEQDQLPSPSPSRTPKAGSLSDIDIGARKRKAELATENTQTQSRVPDEPRLERLHTERSIHLASAYPDRIDCWVHESRWPERDFEPDPMAGPALKRTRLSSSASDSLLDDLSATPSDQKSRERKSDPYRDARYATLLEMKGSFMHDSEAGISAADSKFCRTLLNFKKNPPLDTLFDDRFFDRTMSKFASENEARLVRDIAQLICPSAECLATRGMKRLSHLKESTNAGWNASIPFAGPRPQPDFSVGFGRDAFSEDQLKKLNFDLYGKTYFTGTWQIYFPFLTSEVNQGLDIADRQNAHSMTLAVRGVIDLYQKVKRAPELHRKVLAFSISHDQHSVRIHSHYAEIDGSAIKYYRHRLKEIMILGDDGKDRWTAYQFVRNVYGSFAPVHLRRIKGAIDQLPDPTLELFQPIQRAEGAESSREMTVTSAALSQTTAATPTRGVAAELRKQLEQQRQEAEQERQESEQRFEERLRREKQESEERFKQRHEELMEQNTKLMDLLAQRLT